MLRCARHSWMQRTHDIIQTIKANHFTRT